MKDLHGLLVLTSGQKKFGRFLKTKDQEPKEEDRQTDATRAKEEISPTHVTGFGTARDSISNFATSW